MQGTLELCLANVIGFDDDSWKIMCSDHQAVRIVNTIYHSMVCSVHPSVQKIGLWHQLPMP